MPLVDGKDYLVDLVSLLLLLVVVGLIWYLITNYVPMPAPIKTVITVVAVLVLCIWLLQWSGLTHLSLARPR